MRADPAIRLLLGSSAISTLEKIERGQPASLLDLALLSGSLESAAERGQAMKKRLTAPQRTMAERFLPTFQREIEDLIIAHLPPEGVEAILLEYHRRRQRNPDVIGRIALEPYDESDRSLILRVADLYRPVYRWEPQIRVEEGPEQVVLHVSGDDRDLVDKIVLTIFETLKVNDYRGLWTTDRRRFLITDKFARELNQKRRRLLA